MGNLRNPENYLESFFKCKPKHPFNPASTSNAAIPRPQPLPKSAALTCPAARLSVRKNAVLTNLSPRYSWSAVKLNAASRIDVLTSACALIPSLTTAAKKLYALMTLAVAKIAALIVACAPEQHMSLAAPRSLILDVQISPAASKIIVLIDVFAPDKNLNLAAKCVQLSNAQTNLAADKTNAPISASALGLNSNPAVRNLFVPNCHAAPMRVQTVASALGPN